MHTLSRLFGLLALVLLITRPSGGGEAPAENAPTVVHIARFAAADGSVAAQEAHLVAHELLLNRLAATQKFSFAATPDADKVELVVTGSVAHTAGAWSLELHARRAGSTFTERLAPRPSSSLEQAADDAAQLVSKLHRRSGYVLKREGDRIVIARGSLDGIVAGQKYRTTDTGESFEIVSVAPHTAEGRILGAAYVPGPAVAPSVVLSGDSKKIGAVDVVFVLDVSGSMQEEIDGVLHNCVQFATQLEAKRIDARLALVTFRDTVVQALGPTASPAEFREWLRPLRAGLGGDEVPFQALERAQRLPFRPGAKRVYVLITDEPAYDVIAEAGGHTAGMIRNAPYAGCGTTNQRRTREQLLDGFLAQRVTKDLGATKSVVYSVTLRDAEQVYPYLAASTGGAFFDLEGKPEFSSLLGDVGERIGGMFTEL